MDNLVRVSNIVELREKLASVLVTIAHFFTVRNIITTALTVVVNLTNTYEVVLNYSQNGEDFHFSAFKDEDDPNTYVVKIFYRVKGTEGDWTFIYTKA